MSESRPTDPAEGPLEPLLPDVTLTQVGDRSPPTDGGFLHLLRRRLVARYADGTESAPFEYDEVSRRATDAVAIAAHFAADGQPHVYLRSSLRPPAGFRAPGRSSVAERSGGALWELPAGLIEPEETGPEGVLLAASRELFEELGFDVAVDGFQPLGPSSFPCPGVLAERLFFVRVEVVPNERGEPGLDGSALERGGRVISLPLARALEACRSGEIEDAKTELGLRRLAESLAPE